MPGKFQNWFEKNVWEVSKSSSNMTISGSFWDNVFGSDNLAEERISEQIAHRIATVYSCINVRSRTISSLPINTYQEKDKQKKIRTDHDVYWLLGHEPNNFMTSANMILTSMIHSDSWGNSYIYIHRDANDAPAQLELLSPWDVSPKIVNGMAFYVVNGESYPARDMLHFRWFSYDGLCGISPIRQNADTFGSARKQDRYSTMAIGKRPPGVLTYEGRQTAEARAENQKSWNQDLEAGRTPILSGSWKFNPIIIPPGDAEIIASKKLTKLDILGIYQMPPAFVQDYERQTFSNAEQSDLIYAKHTVTPIIRVIEQECNMKLFTQREKKTHYVKFNMNGLLRGDLEARQKFYQAMVNTGLYNRNELRSLDDLNAYEGGDDFLVQSAMAPADMLRDFYEKKVMPTVPGPTKNYVNGHTVN